MITQIIQELKKSPLTPIIKIEWNEYSLTLIGAYWSFSTVSSWRISKSNLFTCGCCDPKAAQALENIQNSQIVSVDIQSTRLFIDPTFVFSNQFMLEIFSTTFLEPWVFSLPSGICYVASPSDPKNLTYLELDP